MFAFPKLTKEQQKNSMMALGAVILAVIIYFVLNKSGLTNIQVGSLLTAQINALTPAQLGYFTAGQMIGLTAAQLVTPYVGPTGSSPTNVALINLFTAAQIAMAAPAGASTQLSVVVAGSGTPVQAMNDVAAINTLSGTIPAVVNGSSLAQSQLQKMAPGLNSTMVQSISDATLKIYNTGSMYGAFATMSPKMTLGQVTLIITFFTGAPSPLASYHAQFITSIPVGMLNSLSSAQWGVWAPPQIQTLTSAQVAGLASLVNIPPAQMNMFSAAQIPVFTAAAIATLSQAQIVQ